MNNRRMRLCWTTVLLVLGVTTASLLGADREGAGWSSGQAGLTQALGPGFTSRSTGHFLIVEADPQWARRVGPMLEFTWKRFYDDFTRAGFHLRKPSHPLVWICFGTRGEFEQYARRADQMDMSWSEGYYSSRTNRVALYSLPGEWSEPVPARIASKSDSTSVSGMERHEVPVACPDAARATHETAHQLAFNSGLQKRGVLYPLWAAEGLATNFEADASGVLELGRDNPTRRGALIDAAGSGRLTPLEELVVTTRVPGDSPRQTTELYAQCWGLFRFLLSRYPAELRDYFARVRECDPGYRDERTLRREFTRSFGSIDSVQRAWTAYIGDLRREQGLAVNVR